MSETSRQGKSHIDSIVRQEEEALQRRSRSERLADGVGGFAGSLSFVAVHLVLVIAWLPVNGGKILSTRPFDPYPFSLLGAIVAVEAVILSSFILMRQNRMMRRGERRDHLNLQVPCWQKRKLRRCYRWCAPFVGTWGCRTSQMIRKSVSLARTPLLNL
jgi:uncharacterized membrane protein